MANKKKKKVNSVPAEKIAADMNPAGNAQPSAEEVSKSLAEGLKDIPPLTETQELPEKTAEEMTLSAVLDGADLTEDSLIEEVELPEEDFEEVEEELPEPAETTEKKKSTSALSPLLKMVAVLTVISMSIALLLSAVNAMTKDVIAENVEKQKNEAVLAVFPEGTDVKPYITADGEEVYIVLKDNEILGCCVNAVESGYAGDVSMMIGLNTAHEVCGIRIVSMSETPGVGTKISGSSFLEQFFGMSEPVQFGVNADAVSGATYSSRAVESGINTALGILVDYEDAAASIGADVRAEDYDPEDHVDANESNGDEELNIGQAGEAGAADIPAEEPAAEEPISEPADTPELPAENDPVPEENEPVPVVVPETEAQPDPVPVVVPDPEPQPEPAPVVVPDPEPQPEPVPVVVPDPEPQPEPAPVVVPNPEPQPEPAPVVVPDPEPQPEPAPVVVPDPEPEPEPAETPADESELPKEEVTDTQESEPEVTEPESEPEAEPDESTETKEEAAVPSPLGGIMGGIGRP